MTAENTAASAPWYKHPWLWFVIFVPVFTIALCFSLLYVAVVNKDPDVRDDWYKDKKAINQNLSRDNLAIALKLQGEVSFAGQEVGVTVSSQGSLPDGVLPAELDLVLSHPTDQKRDIHTELKLNGNRYIGTMAVQPTGRYYLELGCQTWRLKETVTFPASTVSLNAHTL